MRKPRSGRRVEGRDLDKEAKERGHDREQDFLDFLYRRIIPATFILFLAWYLVWIGHAAWVRDWDNFENIGKQGLKVLAPYVLGFFTRLGVISK